MAYESEILKQNEIDANNIMATAMFITAGGALLTGILILAEFFDQPRGPWLPVLIVNILVLFAGAGVCKYYKGDKPWLKTMMITILMLVFAGLDGMLVISSSILMVMPVVLSIRYFSQRFSLNVALITLVLFVLSSTWGAVYGIQDLNNVELPVGTVIVMEDTTWLGEVVVNLETVKGTIIPDTLLFSFLPKSVLFGIVAFASIKIAGQGRILVVKQKDLTEKTARLTTELDMASNIQSGSLPQIFPAFPDRKEFDIYSTMEPAKEVGGDFYDFFMVDDDHLAVVVADVSGKGVPAALFMMISKTLIRNFCKPGMTPHDVLLDTNAALAKDNKENMFVTVWFGILEISTGKLTYADAGHEKLILYHGGEWTILPKKTSGIALGMMEQEELDMMPDKIKFNNNEIILEPGDAVFQYTDGVTEATDAAQELFGEQRLAKACNDAPDTKPTKFLPFVRGKIDEFVKEAPQFDDLTMLELIYYGDGN